MSPSEFNQRPGFPGDGDLVGIDEKRPPVLAGIGAADLTAHSTNRTISEHLRNAVECNALELHLQPIVNISHRQPEYYESTLRLKEPGGKYVDQQKLNRLAGEARLAAALDSQLLFSAIRVLRTLSELQKRTSLFCPISGFYSGKRKCIQRHAYIPCRKGGFGELADLGDRSICSE